MNKVFIANFGAGNWAWEDCLQQSCIAVMDDVRVHPFWQVGDKEGYIAEAVRVLQSKAGTRPIRAVAARWFNVPTIMTQTQGDLWIHRAGENLWWTYSLAANATSQIIDDPLPRDGQNKIYIYRKPCEAWSNATVNGTPLPWHSLHAKAKDFLETEATCQQLSPEIAKYAEALIHDRDLTIWHTSAVWLDKAKKVSKNPIKTFNSAYLTAVRMADTAWQTIAQSGKATITNLKIKQAGFERKQELEEFIALLIESQERLCALSGLTMMLDVELHDASELDRQLACSLDRIDSSGHYTRDNLQIVCKFANRWKNSSNDADFRKLIAMVRTAVI